MLLQIKKEVAAKKVKFNARASWLTRSGLIQDFMEAILFPASNLNTQRSTKDPNCARMFSYSAPFLSLVRHCKADSLTKIRGRIIR